MSEDLINLELSINNAKALCTNLLKYFKYNFCTLEITEYELENEDLADHLVILKPTGFDKEIKTLLHNISLLKFKYKRLLYYRYILGYNATSLKNGTDGIYIRNYNQNHKEALRKLTYTNIDLIVFRD